jgi:glycosyltransferase involved in cell wall biosynthesis
MDDPALGQPGISVVVAVRNGAATLAQCLTSVTEQDYQELELIVIDGGSRDGTVAILERAPGIAYWESKPDRGIYHAWNKALDHVRGDWVCFLGADDRLAAPDVISRAAAALQAARDGYTIVYGSVKVVDQGDTELATVGEPWPSVRNEFRRRMAIPHPGVFHHRGLFERHGRFDEGYRIAGDYEFLLRELVDHDALFIPGLVLVEMRAGGLSDRRQNALLILHENMRARYAHGLTEVPEPSGFARFRARTYERLERRFGQRAAARAVAAYRGILGKRPPA